MLIEELYCTAQSLSDTNDEPLMVRNAYVYINEMNLVKVKRHVGLYNQWVTE
jgi:hypothetical protein